MASSTAPHTRAPVADPGPLQINPAKWRALTSELARRGQGRRESGAFLLARSERQPRHVVEAIPFDEIDPHALNGAISIRGTAFGRLWEICRERGLRVVADVHTHPGRVVRQSRVDQANPMIAKRGHTAIILPDYAQGDPQPRDSGVHVYAGDRTWVSHYGEQAARQIVLR